MKNVNAAAKLVGLEGSTDHRAIRTALFQRFAAEMDDAAFEDEKGGFAAKAAGFAKLAKLEDMANAYEEAGFEEDDGDEPAHALMRSRMAKLAAKLAGEPEEKKDEPVEHAKLEDDTKEAVKQEGEDAKMEDEKDDKKALQAMARRLGLPENASASRIATTMEARTVGLDQLGAMEKRLAEVEKDRKDQVKIERKRAAEVTFSQAVAAGRTKMEKRAAFISTYERSPRDAEELLFTPGTFASSDVLMSRMTIGGAPVHQSIREGSSMGGLDQRVVNMAALGSTAKALVFGDQLSKHVTSMADSQDPTVRARIDAELPDGTKGTKFERVERYFAAERITKRERPDLVLAASEEA